jgi:hypothetical protein
MTAPTTIADSQGTTFTFNSVDFIATQVKVKKARAAIDVTPLSQASGTNRKYQGAGVNEVTINCDYYGTTAPDIGVVHTLSCSTLSISGDAICEDFELTAKVGELIVGAAAFRLSGGT